MENSILADYRAFDEILNTFPADYSDIRFLSEKIKVPYQRYHIKFLVSDGMIEDLQNGQYRMTMKGFTQKMSGGYVQRYKNAKAERYQRNLINRTVALGTGLAGLYALVQFVLWLLSLFFCGIHPL